MRMIDADELIRNLESIISDYTSNGIYPEKFGIDDFIDVVKEIPTIPAPQWISVEDRLPEESKEVLIYLPEYNSVETASLFTIPSLNLKKWTQDEDAFMLDEVSHWMPMPEPPKEDVQ